MSESAKFTVAELEELAPTLSLEELRALYANELDQGDGKTRKGALAALEAAIDAHPDQRAAIEQAPPAVNEAALDAAARAALVTGTGAMIVGPDGNARAVDIFADLSDDLEAELAQLPADTALATTLAPLNDLAIDADLELDPAFTLEGDDLAAIREAVAVLDVAAMNKILAERTPFDVLFALAGAEGLTLVFGDRAGAHPELAPVALDPGQLVRFLDTRFTVDAAIALDGLGLERPLAIDLAALYGPRLHADDAPALLRLCEIPSNLVLEPGRTVGFGRGHLVF